MIIAMTRVRVLGRKDELARTLSALQDAGTLHLADPEPGPLAPRVAPPGEGRRARHLARVLDDVDAIGAGLRALAATLAADPAPGPPASAAATARRAATLRRQVEALIARRRALADERDLLRGYAPLFDELDALLARGSRRAFAAFLLRFAGGGDAPVARVRAALDRVVPGAYDLRARATGAGETALLLLVPVGRADELERLLHGERVGRAPLPDALAGLPLVDALPRLRPRLAEVERALTAVGAEAAALAAAIGPALERDRRALHDELDALAARGHAAETARGFVVEGWVPAAALPALTARLRRELGATVAVEEIARDRWHGREPPVVLHNPPLFAPFERMTAMLPLPRYGTVDPTPLLAVFFPMLFGLIVGDVGYGAVIALAAGLLGWRGRTRPVLHDLARIAAAVAAYTVLFGFAFGELFGDLGAHAFGLRPLWLDREEAVLPFLGLAIGIGLVHLLLGLIVAAIARRAHPREAAGRGLAALMLALVAVALLATFELLPRVLFTPALVALVIGFPILIALEGFTALLELVTVLGHVLSYARVMALGTASVMLAIVANRMVGAFGGAAIGVVFALVFHLVNFAIALFSPTIHVLRLHYVEFFGTFFSPGGQAYRPLARTH